MPEDTHDRSPRITIDPHGPYTVYGPVPLVHKRQVVSEHGEPLTWTTDPPIDAEEPYCLCRCGHSTDKPFCSGAHHDHDFDGTETADAGRTAERRVAFEGGTGIVVRKDGSLCTGAGFCGTRLAGMRRYVRETGDSVVRSLVIAMVDRCPSGSLTFALGEGQPDIEPDLKVQIAAATEITSDGPIEGPLIVTGGVPVERADGRPCETRNRVTLCRCGCSENKPLCDGAHRVTD
jgi:CDGSH-type Zn-finger protein